MTKGRIVPKCKTGYKSVIRKDSVFKMPKHETLRKQWEEAISGITSLKETQSVCERHFESHLIKKKFLAYDANGRLIAEAPFKHPRLENNAVPTIFNSEDDSEALLTNEEENVSSNDTPTSNLIEQQTSHAFETAMECKEPLTHESLFNAGQNSFKCFENVSDSNRIPDSTHVQKTSKRRLKDI